MCREAAHKQKYRGITATVLLPTAICFFSSISIAAEVTRPAYTPPPPTVTSGSIIQIIISLLLVLVAIVLVAWLLKRMNVAQQSGGLQLKILGGVSIGQRERIVLVEIEDTWLVVGVGPGQIRTLHTLQKSDGTNQKTEAPSPSTLPAENRFSSLLSAVLSHRKQGDDSK